MTPTLRPAARLFSGHHIPLRGRDRGFSLVEMMVALVLGLLVLGGIVMLLQSNRQASATGSALSRVDGAARTAFLMLSRDLRSSGNTPCGSPPSRVVNLISPRNDGDVANVSYIHATPLWWWLDWNEPIRGYGGSTSAPFASFGGGAGDRTTGTDALSLITTKSDEAAAVLGTDLANTRVVVDGGAFSAGDVVMACSPVQASMMLVTGVSSGVSAPGNPTSGTGLSFDPGCVDGLCSCSTYLGGDSSMGCSNTLNDGGNGKNIKKYGMGASVAPVSSVAWYVGPNAAGTSSLWRVVETPGAKNAPTISRQEIVRGVSGMSVFYQEGSDVGDWEKAADVARWDRISAVKVSLTLTAGEKANPGLGDTQVSRTVTSITTLRNRVL